MVNVWRCGDDGRLDHDEEEEHLPVSPFRIEASDENGVWLGGWQALVPCLLRMRQQNNGGDERLSRIVVVVVVVDVVVAVRVLLEM